MGVRNTYSRLALRLAIKEGKRSILISGPRGSGKTIMIAEFLHDLALRYPGMNQLWTRSDRSRLTDAVLRGFEEEILGRNHPLHSGKDREQRHSYLYPNGSRIILQGLDDPQRQKSVGADVIWVNEPTEASLDQIEELAASMRETISSSCPIKLLIGDHNPAPLGHWTNKQTLPLPDHLYPRVLDNGERMGEWMTPEMYRETLSYNCSDQGHRFHRIQSFHPDNWGYWDWERWTWKRPGLDYVLDVLGRYHGSRRARYLEGRPAATENVVFPEFSARHIIKPFKIPKDWPCVVAKDPGRDHNDATLLAAVSPETVEIKDKNGELHKLYKLYFADERITGNASDFGRATTTEEDAKALDEWSAKYRIVRKLGDPHYMFSETKHSADGSTIAQQFRRYGHVFEAATAARNQAELAAQCDLIRTGLTTNFTDGSPMVQVFNTCSNLIRGYQTWGYQRNSKGEMKGGEDRFEDVGDDEMDANRMIVTSNPRFESPKWGVSIQSGE